MKKLFSLLGLAAVMGVANAAYYDVEFNITGVSDPADAFTFNETTQISGQAPETMEGEVWYSDNFTKSYDDDWANDTYEFFMKDGYSIESIEVTPESLVTAYLIVPYEPGTYRTGPESYNENWMLVIRVTDQIDGGSVTINVTDDNSGSADSPYVDIPVTITGAEYISEATFGGRDVVIIDGEATISYSYFHNPESASDLFILCEEGNYDVTASYTTSMSTDPIAIEGSDLNVFGNEIYVKVPMMAMTLNITITPAEDETPDTNAPSVAMRITDVPADLIESIVWGNETIQSPTAAELADLTLSFADFGVEKDGEMVYPEQQYVKFNFTSVTAGSVIEPKYVVNQINVTYTMLGSTDEKSFAPDADGLAASIAVPVDAYTMVVTFDMGVHGDITFSMNINNAAGVVVVNAIDDSTIAVRNGLNEYKVPFDDNTIKISAAEGFEINNVTLDGEAVDAANGIYTLTVWNDSQVVVNVTALEGADVFSVYLEEGYFTSGTYTTNGGTVSAPLNAEGETNITFNANAGQYYQISVVPAEAGTVYTFVNGVNTDNGRPVNANENVNVWFGVPFEGLAIEVYGDLVDAYELTFIAPENTEGITVGVDGYELTGWATAYNPYNVLAGTVVTVVAPADAYVFVNGEQVESIIQLGNTYLFDIEIEGDTEIDINYNGVSTGVDSINVTNGEEVIYNMQGVRVDRNKLSNGIYIINGVKTVIR